jgi:hypothetical protein
MTKPASPVRVQQRSAAYWDVTFDNPPINLHDAEVVAGLRMVTEIGIRGITRPAVEDPGQGGSLPASRWQVLLQDEHQDNVALRGEVRDILGDDGPASGPGGRRHLRVGGRSKACLGDMDGIVAVLGAQELGRGRREHLIDQEGGHARRASRCRAVWRLRSAMARLRSIRSRISSACSAA